MVSSPIVRLSARSRSSAPAETASLTSWGTVMPAPNTSRTTLPYCWSLRRHRRGGANASEAAHGVVEGGVTPTPTPPAVAGAPPAPEAADLTLAAEHGRHDEHAREHRAPRSHHRNDAKLPASKRHAHLADGRYQQAAI